MKKILLASAVLCAGLSIHAAHPLGLDENQPYGILSDKYVTPHIKWAKPYAGKKLSVLVIAPISTQRETVELAQRMDISFDGWMTQGFDELENSGPADFCGAFFYSPSSVMVQALKKKLEKTYDVYIIGKVHWEIIPSNHRIKILEQVANGAGLVLVNPLKSHRELDILFKQPSIPAGAQYIRSGVPAEALAPFKTAKDEIRTYSFADGRVVVLDYGEKAYKKHSYKNYIPSLTPPWDPDPFAKGLDPHIHWSEFEFENKILKVPYEYAMARLARAVLWSAGNEKTVPVNVVMKSTIPAGEPSSFKMDPPFRAAVRDLRAAGIKYDLGSSNQIPALPGGTYILDVWKLDSAGKVLNWKSVSFTAQSDVRIGSVKLDKRFYNSGDEVTGMIEFSGRQPALKDIAVTVYDNLERQVSLPAKLAMTPYGSVKFSVTPMKADVPLHKIRINVKKNGGIVANKDYFFPIRTTPKHRFVEIAWGTWFNNPFSHFMLEKLKKDDATDVLMNVWGGGFSSYNIARGNANSIIYGARYGVFGKTKDHTHRVRNTPDSGCMSNPNVLKALNNTMTRLAKVHGPYAPVGYTHGDETYYSSDPSSCMCKYCLDRLRNHLKAKYGTIANVNKMFRTNYVSFEKLIPPTYEEAKKSGNYAMWLAHRQMAAVTLTDFYGKSQKYLRDSGDDPFAKAGFDGIQSEKSPNGGTDMKMLSSNVQTLNCYTYANSSLTRLLGAFTNKDYLSGGWYGSYGDSTAIAHNTVPAANIFPYQMLFAGLNSSWFWTMGYAGGISGIAGDMTSLPYLDARTKSLKEIHTGIGEMILDSEMTDDGIAVYYDDNSRILDAMLSKDANCNNWVYLLDGLRTALEDSGYVFRFIVPEQLDKVVNTSRVIMMPNVTSISDANAALIRKFVEKGGIIVADNMPGIYDELGRKRTKNPLADLFSNAKYKKNVFLIGDIFAKYRLDRSDNSSWKTKAPLKGLEIRKLLTKAGVLPKFNVKSVDGKPFPAPTVYSFANGNVQYVGLIRDYWLKDFDTYKLNMTLPQEHYVYDSRAGKYLGKLKEVRFEQDYQVKLFSLLPGKAGSLNVKLPAAVRPGDAVKVNVSMKMAEGKLPDAGAYRILVLSPDGKNLMEYERIAYAKSGKAVLEFRTAFNQKAGKYQVMVRDAATGIQKTVSFEVK